MTDAIHAIRALMPQTLRSQPFRWYRKAVDALGASVRAYVVRRRTTTLRVSDAWLRENEIGESRRRDP